jgi:hypothetical protein
MQIEYTTNNIKYSWTIANSNGASFILYPNSNHTKDDIKKAKSEIRHNQDVVSIKVADKYDIMELYKSDIFNDPRTKPLKWYQIQSDNDTLLKAIKEGITPKDYVTNIVLPNIKNTERKLLRFYGKSIYSI